jgi:hypothetical protein
VTRVVLSQFILFQVVFDDFISVTVEDCIYVSFRFIQFCSYDDSCIDFCTLNSVSHVPYGVMIMAKEDKVFFRNNLFD